MVFILVGSLFTGSLVLVHRVRITIGELLGLISGNEHGAQHLSHRAKPGCLSAPAGCLHLLSIARARVWEDAVKKNEDY